ncbi:MAG: asparaginase [Lachnospiraceae bacterium]|nr:asparaginase [Lachnospiraceae bacterium]
MKKILLLSTGGTIASIQTEHGLMPGHSADNLLSYVPNLNALCEIEYKEIINLDSTNLQPENWIQMAKTIALEQNHYDGIVITHGTDTMAYSASALSFMLQNIKKPIILTGSQLSITEQTTDAIQNLYDAFCTAVSGIPGVYIVFSGRIIQGVRARKLYTKEFDAFHSINSDDIGCIKNGKVILKKSISTPKNPFTLDLKLNTKVLTLRLLPGTEPELIDKIMELGYDGIILEAFGCGGVPNQGRNLLPCLKRANELGTTIVIASQCLYESVDLTVYDVNVQAAKLGVISSYDMTPETTAVKLMWVLGHTSHLDKIHQMMNTCYVGEFTEDLQTTEHQLP